MSFRSRLGAAACLALLATLAAACADDPQSAPGTTVAAPQTVSVMGLWSGPELASFRTVASAWETENGTTVDWQGSQDLAGSLTAAIEKGTAPDIAVLPNPGLLHELAGRGALVPLDTVLDMDAVEADYAQPWLDLGSDGNRLYGLFYKVTDKSTVWYDPGAFADAGYAVPATWEDLIALADTMVAAERAPFSVVAPAGPAVGWALTDWVSLLVLGGCGVEVFDGWVDGDIAWTRPCIREAFVRFEQILSTPGYVLGGDQAVMATTDAAGAYPLYADPPAAYMYVMASFAQAFIAAKYPDLVAGEGYDTFPFPTMGTADDGAVMVGADIVVMLNDTPAARSLMTYLAGAPAQQAWIDLGGFTSVNRSVLLDHYPDPVARAIARRLRDAPAVRFSAGDLLPAALQREWWSAMTVLVANPSQLDPILQSLDDTASASP